MEPRPPDPWPPRPPPSAHGATDPGPWRVSCSCRLSESLVLPSQPPSQQYQRDMDDGRDHGPGDYGGHYAPHSQYYHPEKMRRHRQPESFWFTQHPPPPPPPPPHSHHPPPPPLPPPHSYPPHPPPPPPHSYPPHPPPPPPHSYPPPPPPPPPAPYSYPLPPPPPPHAAGDWDQWQSQETSESTLQSSQQQPPSLTGDSVTERVSAVDLIKSYHNRGDTGTVEKMEEQTQQTGERECNEMAPNPSPPWLLEEDKGGEREVDEVTAERDRETKTAEEEKEEEEEAEKEQKEEEEKKYEDSFVGEVRRFVQRTADTFDIVTRQELVMDDHPTLHNFTSEDSFKYAEPDALEYHMQVPKAVRKQSFFKLIEPGDVVQGHVVAKRYSGLTVQITSFVNSHKYRELSDLSIRGIVPFDNLAENNDKCEEVMRDMQLEDVVQGVVVTVDVEEETLVLTFHARDLPGVEPESLGYRAGKRPVPPRPSVVRDGVFLEQLQGDQGFMNPEARSTLYQSLGLTAATSFRHTLHRDLQTAVYAEEDYAKQLRKAQRFKWSMKTVAVGVEHFKSGKHEDARQVLNHALDIDPSNVEGLVARGALSATTGQYKEGIADFRKALSLKSSHRNARNYLVETQVVYGKRLEEQGRVEEAMDSYREALGLDPTQETTRGRLEALTVAMEAKTARMRERERQAVEEQEKLARVRRVIEKEKRKQLKEKKSKQKKRRKSGEGKKVKKRSKKTSRKKATTRYSSSSEDESSESESESEGGGGSRKKTETKRDRRERTRNKKTRKKSLRDSSTDDSYDSEEKTTPRKRSKYSSDDEKAAAYRKRSKYISDEDSRNTKKRSKYISDEDSKRSKYSSDDKKAAAYRKRSKYSSDEDSKRSKYSSDEDLKDVERRKKGEGEEGGRMRGESPGQRNPVRSPSHHNSSSSSDKSRD